jgi:hypothetical protein
MADLVAIDPLGLSNGLINSNQIALVCVVV